MDNDPSGVLRALDEIEKLKMEFSRFCSGAGSICGAVRLGSPLSGCGPSFTCARVGSAIVHPLVCGSSCGARQRTPPQCALPAAASPGAFGLTGASTTRVLARGCCHGCASIAMLDSFGFV